MKKVCLVNSESLGHGSSELGARLMGSFLRKLWASETKPEAIVFLNSGVKLMATGSAVLDALDGLVNSGVDLLACGTCVQYYGLEEKVRLGRVSNMDEIAQLLMTAENVITL